MISRIEALNYRCLCDVDRALSPFQILVGPNASGKTTFLDVVGFLGDLVSEGLDFACDNRTQNFYDLVWERSGKRFDLAVEMEIPQELRAKIAKQPFPVVRYDVSIGINVETQEKEILRERVLLKEYKKRAIAQRRLFPEDTVPRSSLFKKPKGAKTVVNKIPDGNDNFYSEVTEKGGGWPALF